MQYKPNGPVRGDNTHRYSTETLLALRPRNYRLPPVRPLSPVPELVLDEETIRPSSPNGSTAKPTASPKPVPKGYVLSR